VNEHTKNKCPQADRLERIEDELENHKEWRKETSNLLSEIHLQVAAQTERLRYFTEKVQDRENGREKLELEREVNRTKWDAQRETKIDSHIKSGDTFRAALVLTAIGLMCSVITAFIGYGRLEQKVDFVYNQIHGVAK